MKVLARPRGLAIDMNSIVPTDGAMREALHVVADQPGVVRARQTNDLYATKTSTNYRPRAMQRYGAEIVAISTDGADWRLEDEGAVITGPAEPPSFAQIPRFMESRGSLYHTSNEGIQKHIAQFPATRPAGVEAHVLVSGSQPNGCTLNGGPLPGTPLEVRFYFDTATVQEGDVIEWYKTLGSTDYTVSVVIKSIDGNGYVRRSPPTVVDYRGTNVGGTEAYLWVSYTVTDTDITNGYVLISTTYDIGPPVVASEWVPFPDNDDNLGEALYTNPGQQGALGAKFVPPVAAEMALFAGVAWYGNTASKQRVTIRVADVSGSVDDYLNTTGLFGANTNLPATADITAASNTITGISDDFLDYARVGMFVTDATNTTAAVAGTYFSADTLITSIVDAGSTINLVLSKPALASGSGINILLGDVVSVGGRNFYAWAQDEFWTPDELVGDDGRRVFGVATSAISATGRLSYTAATLSAAINYESVFDPTFRIRAIRLGEQFVYSGTVTTPSDLLLEEIGSGGASFTVDSSNPTAFSPALPLTSENDQDSALLWWSEIQEPEAVPITNFVRVGEGNKAILALTALRSSLLVWKEDGLFRVTGTAPDAWRVDVVDAHVRLVNSGSVDVSEGYAYAWTEAGVVRATETGVQVISHQIASLLSEYATPTMATDSELVMSWLHCWRSENLVLLGLQGEQDQGAAIVFALSLETGSWTRFWLRDSEVVTCATYASDEGRFYWSRGNAWEVRRFAQGCGGSDRTYDMPSAVSSGDEFVTVPTANLGTWIPQAGDWVKRDVALAADTYGRIVDVSVDGTDTVIELADPVGASGEGPQFKGIEGLPCVLEWQNVGPAGAWQAIREMQAHVDGEGVNDGPETLYLAMGGTTSLTTAEVVSATKPRPIAYGRPYRYGVPRAVARSAYLFPRVEINALGYAWRLHEVAVIGDPVSEKVRR